MVNARKLLTDIASFLAIVLMPWQARWIFAYHELAGERYEYGVFSVYAGSIIVIIAAAFLLYRLNFPKNFRPVYFWSVIAWLIISSLIAPSTSVAFFYSALAIIAFGYFVIASQWTQRKVMISIVAAGMIQAAFAWFQFIIQKVSANTVLGVAEHLPHVLGQSVVLINGKRILRAYALLPHPNILGGLLVVSFIVLVYFFIQSDRPSTIQHFRQRIMLIISALFLFSGILITFSRAALLSVVVFLIGWVMYAGFRKNNQMIRKIGRITVYSGLLFLVFNLMASNIWLDRFGVTFGSPTVSAGGGRLDALSNNERLGSYQQAQSLMNARSIFLGYGLGNYVPQLAQEFPSLPSYSYQPAHNVYVMMLLEFGVIGILLLLWITITVMRDRWYECRGQVMYQYLFSIVIVLFFMGLFDHFLWTSYFGQSLWWLALGLAANKSYS